MKVLFMFLSDPPWRERRASICQKSFVAGIILCTCLVTPSLDALAEELIDFNTQIRPILSSSCFACHGPDESERAADLRLDNLEGARQDLGGYSAIVPGDSASSELLHRVISEDEDVCMPPPDKGARLTDSQVELLRAWIDQGANYSTHWSYVKPRKVQLPAVVNEGWGTNEIDRFILSRLESRDLAPSPVADRLTLARRLSIDLVGLPPSWEEATRFRDDDRLDAYERYVDSLLEKPAFGERWARVWLDLARYADSAGYADDPPRTIWAFRDYVIKSLNQNKPFDEFTIEQIAGDLLPDPSAEQLIATAFHRNTLTNNEGGTNDEEFRNVAVVDRVNTTMSVWMGTTMACAQCHTHKYDPITQKEYFQLFAFFNNSQDSDRRDEMPIHEVWSAKQLEYQRELKEQEIQLVEQLNAVTPVISDARDQWISKLQGEPSWQVLKPLAVNSDNRDQSIDGEGWIHFSDQEADNDAVTLHLPIEEGEVSGIKLDVSEEQRRNFVLSDVQARWEPVDRKSVAAQFLRIELPGKQKMIHLAEIQLISGDENVALQGKASQSSTDFGGEVRYINDGNTDGNYPNQSVTHTAVSDDPWIEIDLGVEKPIDKVLLWNRTDGAASIQNRLLGYQIALLDSDRNVVWSQQPEGVPQPSQDFVIDGSIDLQIAAAIANHEQQGFSATSILNAKTKSDEGWAVGPFIGQSHQLTLVLDNPVSLAKGRIVFSYEHQSKFKKHLIDHLRLSVTAGDNLSNWAGIPEDLRKLILSGDFQNDEVAMGKINDHFLKMTPLLSDERQKLAAVQKQLKDLKPETTVPIMREREEAQKRTTQVQVRGNYLNTGEVVSPGVPEVFHPISPSEQPSRLELAKWLIDSSNPLTARVIANRHWEQIFGRGIVATSEEFGSQGDLPTHPQLLDWLAVELMESGWDLKLLIKTIVMSSTYQQSSVFTESVRTKDPDNHYYTRGPRFRASAEVIRDQALAVSGLLSSKMFGPPVNPPQPELGLRAAFGSGTDWKTSGGEDRYRRGIYTTWRRSSPYPSMAQFDAPNREVCTVRRIRTNTPLQALVTLNDPVYIEAAQSFARELIKGSDTTEERIRMAYQSAVTRMPNDQEVVRIEQLLDLALANYKQNQDSAVQMATNPLGPLPDGMNVSEAAAWTVVANVILNLDEILMKR